MRKHGWKYRRENAKRLSDSAAVFSEVMSAPDKGIPQELLEHAHCIVIVPDLKTGAFIVGGKYGKGYLSCRNQGGANDRYVALLDGTVLRVGRAYWSSVRRLVSVGRL